VPVLPIAYEFKTDELFARLGLDDFVQPIDTLDDESLCDALDRFLAALPQICALLPLAVESARRSAFAAGDHVRSALARAR
jgi:colanic acid/amylovoran biosynthesis protein